MEKWEKCQWFFEETAYLEDEEKDRILDIYMRGNKILKKVLKFLLGILIAGMVLLVIISVVIKEKRAGEKQIHTDIEPIYNHFPDLPETENIQWCSETSEGIGLTTVRIYVYAFYDASISDRFSEQRSVNEIPDFYFVPENLTGNHAEWRRLDDMKFAFQSGITNSEKMLTSVYLNEAGNVIYMEAVGD